jgi:chromate transporter
MIPLIEAEVVDVHHWMSTEEFIDALAMGNALPGPIATKMAAYTGYKIAGVSGAVTATLGVFLPSMILILILGALFLQYKDMPHVQATLKAVRPAVVALLGIVVYEMFPSSVTSWHTGAIAAVTFIIIVCLKIHPALAIAGAALLGLIVYH